VSTKLDIRAQGREEAEDLEIPVRPLISRTTPIAAPATAEPPTGPQAVSDVARSRSTTKKMVDPLASMGSAFDEYEPLNVRVPRWVGRALNERILEMKKTRKIKKEEVVTTAIIQFLSLVPPE
jgi:hypothetical protein